MTTEPILEKRCTRCGEMNPLSAFNVDRRSPAGRTAACRSCASEAVRKWRLRNPEHLKRTQAAYRERAMALKREHKYGLSDEAYQAMFVAQEGLCLLCRLPETVVHQRSGRTRTLSVDHCHRTGKVRGLLCLKHNQALGALDDDPALFARAIAYLNGELSPA